MNSYQNTQQLYHVVIRTAKNDSMYVYFILESNEGMSFYSTLDHENGQEYRDIDIHTPVELKENLKQILKNISQKVNLTYLLEEEIKDSL